MSSIANLLDEIEGSNLLEKPAPAQEENKVSSIEDLLDNLEFEGPDPTLGHR